MIDRLLEVWWNFTIYNISDENDTVEKDIYYTSRGVYIVNLLSSHNSRRMDVYFDKTNITILYIMCLCYKKLNYSQWEKTTS